MNTFYPRYLGGNTPVIGVTTDGRYALSMSGRALDDTQLSEHFKVAEFVKWANGKPVDIPPAVLKNLRYHAAALEVVRAKLREIRPGSVIIITRHGGFRPPSVNDEIGGAAASQHLLGLASDWFSPGWTIPEIRDVVTGLMASGEIPKGGVHAYAGFLHSDSRGKASRW
jgi:hypothetical protein